jgi:hypothetical protein
VNVSVRIMTEAVSTETAARGVESDA